MGLNPARQPFKIKGPGRKKEPRKRETTFSFIRYPHKQEPFLMLNKATFETRMKVKNAGRGCFGGKFENSLWLPNDLN